MDRNGAVGRTAVPAADPRTELYDSSGSCASVSVELATPS